MYGFFDYDGLRKRLRTIHEALKNESEAWEGLGALKAEQEDQLAIQLKYQFTQAQVRLRSLRKGSSRIELSLPTSGNPFVWQVTLFGEPMTSLDGGIFNIVIRISPDFPSTQPYVSVSTPIFHHRVCSSGLLCYFPEKEDDLKSHIEAVAAALVDKDPRYDPRAFVNPESFNLYWGGAENRRIFNRKLRRSAQDSCCYA